MATTKAKDASELQSSEDLVEVHIPVGNRDDPNFVVSINDNRWIMPRGSKQRVPRFVAEEIERSRLADEHRYRMQQEMIDNAKAAQ